MGNNVVVQHFEFASALRGFHVYKNTENRRPVKGQELTFYREFDNEFDRFAVAGKALFPGKLDPSIVGHVAPELSRHIWHALRYCAIIRAEVKDKRPKRSPSVQGGLEILIEMSIIWDDAVKIKQI